MHTAAIDIWTTSLGLTAGPENRMRAFLSSDERCTAETFRFAEDRERFIARRAFVRSVLASYVQCEPAELSFGFGPNGKPKLVAVAPAIYFNLTHSGGFAGLAVSRDCDVGIDFEGLDRSTEIEIDVLAADYFSSGERKLLKSLSPDERQRMFLQVWTRKEAFVKALGCGLSRPLPSFDASTRIVTEDGRVTDPAWQVIDLDLGARYVAALALPELRYELAWRQVSEGT